MCDPPTFIHEGIFSAVVSLHFNLESKYFWSGQSGALRYLARVCAGPLLEHCILMMDAYLHMVSVLVTLALYLLSMVSLVPSSVAAA